MKTIICSTLIAIVGLYTFVSCKKQIRSDEESLSKVEKISTSVAEKYFSTLIAEESTKSLLVQKKSTSTERSKSKNEKNRLFEISKLIEWNNSFEITINSNKILLVPFKEDIKPFKNKSFEFARFLCFQFQDNSSTSFSIIELLSEKNESIGNARRTATLALTNIIENQSHPIQSLNTWVMVYNQYYKPVESFHISNGKWKKERMEFRSDIEINL